VGTWPAPSAAPVGPVANSAMRASALRASACGESCAGREGPQTPPGNSRTLSVSTGAKFGRVPRCEIRACAVTDPRDPGGHQSPHRRRPGPSKAVRAPSLLTLNDYMCRCIHFYTITADRADHRSSGGMVAQGSCQYSSARHWSWRTRSRLSPSSEAMSSSLRGSSPSSPYRRTMAVRSAGLSRARAPSMVRRSWLASSARRPFRRGRSPETRRPGSRRPARGHPGLRNRRGVPGLRARGVPRGRPGPSPSSSRAHRPAPRAWDRGRASRPWRSLRRGKARYTSRRIFWHGA